jgi:hypothetical protein
MGHPTFFAGVARTMLRSLDSTLKRRFSRCLWSPYTAVCVGSKTTKARPPRVLPRQSDARKLPMRNGNFLLVRKNCFLVCQNCLLIGENLIQRALVLQDHGLILEKSFLIFQNGCLMAEDCFLIRYDFVV